MCRLIGIHVATFKQWRINIYGCSYNFKKCDVVTTNDLLEREKKEILRLLRDRNFSHFSLKSLCFYAKRKGLVYASITTWYKYMKLYQINRETSRRTRKRNNVGVRATRPNELWHIDVTQFKLRGGRKVYLQAIVDNFSRYIVDYEFSQSISAKRTSILLKRAMSKYKVKSILSDAGTENNNKLVKSVMIGRGIIFHISGKNTTWKNSMVESVFAAIKRKRRDFLSETIPEFVMDYVESVIRDYNNLIPHSALEGGTPYEIYHEKWGESQLMRLQERHQEIMTERRNCSFACVC